MKENEIKVQFDDIIVPRDGFPNYSFKKNDKYIFVSDGAKFREVTVVTSSDYCTHEDLAWAYIKERGLEKEYEEYHRKTLKREKDFLIFERDAVATSRHDKQVMAGENFSAPALYSIINFYTREGFRFLIEKEDQVNIKY